MHALFALALCLLLPALSHATEYRFRTVDVSFAGASSTTVTGLNDAGVSVGSYLQPGGTTNGFRLQRPRARVEVLPQLDPSAMTNTELIVGSFGTPLQAFLLQDGVFLPVQVREASGGSGPVLARLTEALAANDAGLTVGDYASSLDGRFHGFVFDPSTGEFLLFTVPGADVFGLTGINNAGQLVGVSFAPGLPPRSFLGDRSRTDLMPADLPDFADAELVGITDDGTLAGNIGSAGFLFQDGMGQLIEVPGAQLTDLNGIRNDGTVYGAYVDAQGVTHGFIAVPDGSRIVPRPHSAGRARAFTQADCLPGSKRMVCRRP